MEKKEIFEQVEHLSGFCEDICRTIWNHPEISGEEKESADFYRKKLEEEGFSITVNARIPYAFAAQYGSGKPVIAILGEYDALPKLSQKAATRRESLIEGGPGHGCGHNLLGAAAVTAAVAVKRMLEKEGIPGTVRFYGCPEEELLSGKVKMAYYHMFDGADAAITWHPGTANMVHDSAYLANASAHFYFKGRTAHAGNAPEQGRSALDAVELMNVGANYLREHVIDRTRIHYTTDSGGFAPNIVPDKASAWYYVRAPHMSDVKNTMDRLIKVAEGAAMMTETKVDVKVGTGCYEFSTNTAFADLAYANLKEADAPVYTEEELHFASGLQKSIDAGIIESEEKNYETYDQPMCIGVADRDRWKTAGLNASSDSGDVSAMMPACLFTTACWPVGCTPHTWQATACVGTSIGEKAAVYAAEVISGIAYDLLTKPEALQQITEEFKERHPEEYVPMYQES